MPSCRGYSSCATASRIQIRFGIAYTPWFVELKGTIVLAKLMRVLKFFTGGWLLEPAESTNNERHSDGAEVTRRKTDQPLGGGELLYCTESKRTSNIARLTAKNAENSKLGLCRASLRHTNTSRQVGFRKAQHLVCHGLPICCSLCVCIPRCGLVLVSSYHLRHRPTASYITTGCPVSMTSYSPRDLKTPS